MPEVYQPNAPLGCLPSRYVWECEACDFRLENICGMSWQLQELRHCFQRSRFYRCSYYTGVKINEFFAVLCVT
jgi:hypothetical protein